MISDVDIMLLRVKVRWSRDKTKRKFIISSEL